MRRLAFLVSLAVGLAAPSAAAADTIRVLTTGAFKQVVVAVAAGFEAQTGHKVDIDNDTAGALVKRVQGGERFDVLVLPPGALRDFAAKGTIVPDTVAGLAKVGVGVAVRAGAPVPPLRTVDDFRALLLGARAVAYIDPASGGSSGIYLAQLFDKLGIGAQVRAKAVLVPGGLVATRLVSGEADVALHQISEILPVAGVTLVGPLPEEIQNYTEYAGGVAAAAARPEAARAFLAAMAGPGAAETIRAKGMLPVR
jgi:molybdate transport system substrate-binding protein